MAHLFLSDLRPKDSEPDPNAPKAHPHKPRSIRRVSPAKKQEITAEPSPLEEQANQPDHEFEGDDRLKTIGVFSHHLDSQACQSLDQFARTLACEEKTVAVLRVKNNFVSIRLLYDAESQADFSEQADDPDADIQTLFSRLEHLHGQKRLDYLLIDWPSQWTPDHQQLCPRIDSFCILTATDQTSMLRTYQLLKTLETPGDDAIGLFVADTDNFSDAQNVYSKLADTSREFIGRRLENFGYPSNGRHIAQRVLLQPPAPDRPDAWIDDLTRWIDSQRSTRHAPQPQPIVAPIPRQDETQETVEIEPEIKNNDDLVIVDVPSFDAPLAEILGKAVLADARPVEDDLIKFLQSIELDCTKLRTDDGKETLILTWTRKNDPTLIAWTMNHYPNRDEKIILFTDHPLGRQEQDLWMADFSFVQTKQIMLGTCQNRTTVIIQK